MKKGFLLMLSFYSLFSFSQSVNDFEFILVPTRFDFQKSENEYRLNTVLKFRLEEYGFKAFYTSDQLNTNYEDRCRYLNAVVVNESGILNTKLVILFHDCNNTVVFKSSVGMSKEKDRKTAFTEALEIALNSVKSLNYRYIGSKPSNLNTNSTTQIASSSVLELNSNSFSAQPIVNGFQLVNPSSKTILSMLKTSEPDFFIANSETVNGIIFKKNGEWFFEYYMNQKLTSEKLSIKF